MKFQKQGVEPLLVFELFWFIVFELFWFIVFELFWFILVHFGPF